MSGYRELLIGCGYARDKRIVVSGATREWKNLTTLDWLEEVKPDIRADLTKAAWSRIFDPQTFEEVHAYEVLEHLGRQGDAESFFDTFNELYYLLKPNGYLCATVPSRFSQWLWGDPGHTRVLLPATLMFLSREQFRKQREDGTSMSDYRQYMDCDFNILRSDDDKTTHRFILQKVSPQRHV